VQTDSNKTFFLLNKIKQTTKTCETQAANDYTGTKVS